MHRPILLLLLAVTTAALLSGCRSEVGETCHGTRVLVDPAGEADQRTRIDLQWAKVRGEFDSLMATREGKASQDRTAGSVERNGGRYKDSLAFVDGLGRSADGCVDWARSWTEGGFDRLAMAQAFLDVFSGDSTATAVEVRVDSLPEGLVLDIDALPAGGAADSTPRMVRFRLDSTRVRPVSP